MRRQELYRQCLTSITMSIVQTTGHRFANAITTARVHQIRALSGSAWGRHSCSTYAAVTGMMKRNTVADYGRRYFTSRTTQHAKTTAEISEDIKRSSCIALHYLNAGSLQAVYPCLMRALAHRTHSPGFPCEPMDSNTDEMSDSLQGKS